MADFENVEGGVIGTIATAVGTLIATAWYAIKRMDIRLFKNGDDVLEAQQITNHEMRRAVEEIVKRLDKIEANQHAAELRDAEIATSLRHALGRVDKVENRLNAVR